MPFKLADTAIRAAKPKEKPCKLTDGEGLYIEVASGGASGGVSSIVLTGRKNVFPWGCIRQWV